MKSPLPSAAALFLAATLSLPASAGLFGPTNNLLKGEPLRAKMASQPLVVSTSGGILEIRSKSAAVGSFLLGFVVSSAMASGGGAPGMNAQQMQQNMQANMQISQAFQQNLQIAMTQIAADQAEKPKAQVAKEGPVVVVSQQVLAGLLQQPGLKTSLASTDKPAAPSDLQLRITQPVWKLDFSMASNDYTLLYETQVSLYQKETDTVFFSETCKGEVPRKLPLEDWQRNDFSEVAQAATEVGKLCAQPALVALGLPPAVAPLALPTAAAAAAAAAATAAPATSEADAAAKAPSADAAPATVRVTDPATPAPQ